MSYKIENLALLGGIIYSKGGYVKLETPQRISVIDDDIDVEIDVMGLAIVAEHTDFNDLKVIDSNYEMWSVSDCCAGSDIEMFVHLLATYPIEHVVSNGEHEDKILEYKDGHCLGLWIDEDGDIQHNEYHSLTEAKEKLKEKHSRK